MFISFLALLLSFCSMSYELILSKAFYLIGLDETLSYTVTISVYLLGLGGGSLLKHNTNSRLGLFNTELLLSLLGAVSIILIWFWGAYIQIMLSLSLLSTFELPTISFLTICFLQLVTFLLGLLSGKELNLLLFWNEKDSGEGLTLSLSYLGGLIASVVVTFFLLPHLNENLSIYIIASINLLAAGLLFLRQINLKNILKFSTVFLFMFCLSSRLPLINDYLLKAQYADLQVSSWPSWSDHKNLFKQIKELETVERYRTQYQVIDFVYDQDGHYSLYINKKPQFYSDNIKSYHQSMIYGFLNLHGKLPQKVLILGGGDGLLAAELTHFKEVKEIHLVDLDQKMLDLARTHHRLSDLNEKALQNNKLKVHAQDAIRFLKDSEPEWEAVFLDFPVPYSYDLGKLYSVEFYRLLKSRLSTSGGAIFDAPLFVQVNPSGQRKPSHPIDLLFSTLTAAGFHHWTAFGPYEGFVYMNSSNVKKSFDYSQIPKTINGAAYSNLLELEYFYPHPINLQISPNTVFNPRRFDVEK